MFRRRSRTTRAPAPPPSWSTAWRGERVLVEHADPEVREELLSDLRARGYDPIGCGGPAAREHCPVLSQEPCPAVQQADAVVTGLVDDRPGRMIARAMLDLAPGRPLLVTGAYEVTADLDPQLQGLVVELSADAIDAALADTD
jgi:hypothetical protein